MDDTLVLNIGQYEVGASELGTLEFVCKPEQMTLFASDDLVGIQLPGTMTYVPRQDKPIEPYYPQIIELHGTLYLGQHNSGGLGATVLPPKMLSFHQPGQKQFFALVFTCARRFLQDLEEQRAMQPGPHVTLGITLYGVAAIVAPVSAVLADTEMTQGGNGQQRLTLGDSARVVVGQLARMGNGNGEYITISRSRWGDELKRIGYSARGFIEIPTIDTERSLAEVQLAAQHLAAARSFYVSDNYRQAVQMCRQARDALLGEDKKTWADENLTAALGVAKTSMVNEAIRALKYLGDAASHGDEKSVTVEVDRDTAEYVIGQLAMILQYIDRKLR